MANHYGDIRKMYKPQECWANTGTARSTSRLPAEVFPPGALIREELEARGWTHTDLADMCGWPLQFVDDLVVGKRPITPETAKGLGDAFGVDPQFFLNLENLSKMRAPLIYIVVPGIPVAQPRQRYRAFVVRGQARVHNYTPATHPVQAFKAVLALAARQAWKHPPLEGPIRVEVTFWFPLPISAKASVKRQIEAGVWVPHTTRPDTDNVWKATIDALTGVIWADDKLISEGAWRKGYGSVPGVEIQVWEL